MHKNIKHAILTRLKSLNLSIAGLERKAGLKINVARNIICGYSKKPSAETVHAISRALGCSIDNLLSRNTTTSSGNNQSTDQAQQNIQIKNLLLYQNTSHKVLEFIRNETSELDLNEFNRIIKEIYLFSLQFNLNIPDKKFTHWILNNSPIKREIRG